MAVQTLIKQPAESRLYSMDFSNLLAPGETLSSVTSVTADVAGLTLGSPTCSGVFAYSQISSGTADVRYKVTFVVVTSAGNTLEGEGTLQVKDL